MQFAARSHILEDGFSIRFISLSDIRCQYCCRSPFHALVAHDGPDAVAAQVGVHLAAGADHVVLLQPIGADFAAAIEGWARIAPALVDLG